MRISMISKNRLKSQLPEGNLYLLHYIYVHYCSSLPYIYSKLIPPAEAVSIIEEVVGIIVVVVVGVVVSSS